MSPFVNPLPPEYVGVLVELGAELASQLGADVAARHAVARGDADGEDDEGEGEHRVALQDLLLDSQQLLGLAEVTWTQEGSSDVCCKSHNYLRPELKRSRNCFLYLKVK